MKTLKQFMDENKERLSYDEFTGKGKEMWDVKFSYGAGRGGKQTSVRTMVGLPLGSTEKDAKKAFVKRHKGKKFISANFKGIRK